ncbi:MAG: purine-binding chemotaxis protein CheW [Actinobacteria bacterium]|nr:purine-binding chemotaxis protein CheW [Actinomycetota bacterium]
MMLRVGPEHYAVPIDQVREIIRWRQPTPLPGQPPHMEGTIELRGEVVSVMDIGTVFRRQGSTGEDRDIVVVEPTADRVVGITVDEVLQVMDTDPAEHHPTPDGIVCGAYVDGVIVADDRLVVKLSLHDLFASLETSEV